MAKDSKVAKRIAMFRERLEMTPEALAEKSGIGVDVIRAVEAGDVYPALGVLTKLSRALGQRLGTFMDDQFKPDPIISRDNDREQAIVSHEGHTTTAGYKYYALAQGKTDRHMDPFFVEIAADAPETLSSHEGEELIIVVSGEIKLQYGGEEHYLKAGDSAYYNSVVQHVLTAAGGKSATIYGIVYMPF